MRPAPPLAFALAFALVATAPAASALDATLRVPLPRSEAGEPLAVESSRGPVTAAPALPVPTAPVAVPDLALPDAALSAGPADVEVSDDAIEAALDLPIVLLAVRADASELGASHDRAASRDALAFERSQRAFPASTPRPPAPTLPARSDRSAPTPEPARDEPDRAPAGSPSLVAAAATRAVLALPPSWSTLATLGLAALFVLLAPLALYHRIRGRQTLEQGTRAAIYELLCGTPGLSPTDAARAVGCDAKTASYHLQRLAKEGFAVPEGLPRRVRYFASGAMPAAERPQHVAAAQSRDVLDAILQGPGQTKSELAQSVGIARPTLGWHLRRLAVAGLVRFERDGRGVRVHPADNC